MDDELPVDDELAGDEPPDRAGPSTQLHPLFLAVVWVGGGAGTCVRYLLSQAVPDLGRLPVAIMGINIVGAGALGVLLAMLSRLGRDVGRRRVLRLLLGTGFFGGFTTYSALAVDTVSLLREGFVGLGAVNGIATVVVGALASLAGIAIGSRLPRVENEGRAR